METFRNTIFFLGVLIVCYFVHKARIKNKANDFLNESLGGYRAFFLWYQKGETGDGNPIMLDLKAFAALRNAILDSKKLDSKVYKRLPDWFKKINFDNEFGNSLHVADFGEMVRDLGALSDTGPLSETHKSFLASIFLDRFSVKMPMMVQDVKSFSDIFRAAEFFTGNIESLCLNFERQKIERIRDGLLGLYSGQKVLIAQKVNAFSQFNDMFIAMKKMDILKCVIHGDEAEREHQAGYVSLRDTFVSKVLLGKALAENGDFKKAFDFLVKYATPVQVLSWLGPQKDHWVEGAARN